MHYKATLGKDKKLMTLIEHQEVRKLIIRENVFIQLIGSIMSQQLSTKVAAVIHHRFLNLYGGTEPTPEQVLATSHETLRSIGLSNAKSRYVHNVSEFASAEKLSMKLLQAMEPDEIIAHLTQIKGVGRWTAEMILMFSLAKEDVFAVDDLGIQNAMMHLYRLDNSDKKKFRAELIRIAEKWSPYRTYACLHLWEWKDNTPIVKEKSPQKKKTSAAKKSVRKKPKVHKKKAAKKIKRK